MWLIGEAALVARSRRARHGSRRTARKAGKTRADESSLNAEAVCTSGAWRVAWRSRAGRLQAGCVHCDLATPPLCTSARCCLRATKARAPRVAAAAVGNV